MQFDIAGGGVWEHRPTRCFNSRRRAACPHAAESPNFMCFNGKTRPHPARCATFSPKAKATIGFSSRRSCHEVTGEVKSHGLILPAAVCGNTALRGSVSCPHAAESTSHKSEAMCIGTPRHIKKLPQTVLPI